MDKIKQLRKSKGESQTQLAEYVGVSLRTIQHYEKGTVDIPFKNLEKIAKHYDVNVSYLFEDEKPKNLPSSESIVSYKGKNGLKFEELSNGKWRVKVPKVPYKAYASFIDVYEDEYKTHESFGETYFTVDHPGKGKYMAFTVGNDSMNGGGINDTPNGAEVLGRELQRHHWKDGFRLTDYGWIIICHSGMFHKDIQGPNDQGEIICKSRNSSPEFPDFNIQLNEVHTIWKVIKRTF